MVLKMMTLIFLTPILTAHAEGTVVGNGGGGSEQAIMIAGGRIESFYGTCLQFNRCGKRDPMKTRIQALGQCALPPIEKYRFRTSEEQPALKTLQDQEIPYVMVDEEFFINRKLLYNANNEALTLSGAVGYLTRLFFDHCNVLEFDKSEVEVVPLIEFNDFHGEQISIGKDDLDLPKADWIKVKSFYTDLVVEASDDILRVNCKAGDLNDCSLIEDKSFDGDSQEFTNLTLVSEKKIGDIVKFNLEGIYYYQLNPPAIFTLEAYFKEGEAQKIIFQDQELELPAVEQ